MLRFVIRGAGIVMMAATTYLWLASMPALARAEIDETFSPANRLLFFTNHLDNVQAPALLHYAFEKRGSLEAPYRDIINMTLSNAGGGKKNVKIRYFTGARSQYVPSITGVEGNPVISLFLQRDINDMEQRTGGSARYFQKRIKLAFENDANIKSVHFDYDGRAVRGTEITVAPYIHDPHRDELKQFVGKHYVFTLSHAVPGEVYELRTVVPGKTANPHRSSTDSKTLLEETLTLAAVKPAAPIPKN